MRLQQALVQRRRHLGVHLMRGALVQRPGAFRELLQTTHPVCNRQKIPASFRLRFPDFPDTGDTALQRNRY